MLHVRHKLYDWGILHSERGALPTLVVGNVELGGTGKTPHVLDLAQRLQTMLGEDTVGVLSRGYGRAVPVQWVSEAQQWQDVGDEPWMMQRRLPSLTSPSARTDFMVWPKWLQSAHSFGWWCSTMACNIERFDQTCLSD